MEEKIRIVSLLPSATEMICALGLGPQLLGITHCCDYPPEIKGKPLVVHGSLPVETLSLSEVDQAVTSQLKQGKSLYTLDEALIAKIGPTLLVTQDLCQVCAPAGREVHRALDFLTPTPQVLWISPHSIAEIQATLRELGEATGREKEAEALVNEGSARLQAVEKRVKPARTRPRIFCAEWVDPLYCSGHWVPEMVEIAGGTDVLGRKGADSVRVPWASLVEAAPDLIVVMSCGFDLASTAQHARWLLGQPRASEIPAIRHNQVYAVDAGYFSRPGPRVIDGTELIAHLTHPELSPWEGTPDAFQRIDCGSKAES